MAKILEPTIIHCCLGEKNHRGKTSSSSLLLQPARMLAHPSQESAQNAMEYLASMLYMP